MFSLFSPYGGYIRHYKLSSFWKGLSEEERLALKEAYAKTRYPESFDVTLIDDKESKEKPEDSIFSFLYGSSIKLFQSKEYDLAEKTLSVATKKVKEPHALHQVYNLLIDVYYKQRETRTDAIGKCISVCRLDMKLASILAKETNDIPSFKRLAIILESQGDFKGAIEVATSALKYGLDDGTKGGYEGRIEKLKVKIQD